MSDKEKEVSQVKAAANVQKNLTLADLPSADEMQNIPTEDLQRLVAQADAQLKILDLREKIQAANNRTTEDRQKREDFEQKNQSLRNFLAERAARWGRCNHRKGGQGADAVMNGQGSSGNYAVIKHILPNGIPMILCQRCGKEWNGKHPVLGGEETPGYQEALNFPTDNSISSSSRFMFQKNV